MQVISRTYNVYGDKDFLTRMEGNCPVWNCKKNAMVFSEDEAKEAIEIISTYKDWMCPDGIHGVSLEEICKVASK